MTNNNYFKNVISAFGNSNILKVHIDKMEKTIIKNKENFFNDITVTPFFSAWIRLYCELVTNNLFHAYYILQGEESIYQNSFDVVLKDIRKYHVDNSTFDSTSEVDQHADTVRWILDMRHCFQHGGMPNYMRDLKYTSNEIIAWFVTPSNYVEIKALFEKAYTFSDRLPKQPPKLKNP